ncbi:DUF6153 family protein [Streptomyces sp. DH37]|uniref:DUF6153 family protein n=1 Tax=Streptomyces sp. DH37 TaxID=3040122 RepID=UPI0024428271|nr:DUF6153 family protein [Streptomyces sp. DH37]MDG9702847.1 DUF6153 family protein [Streptomyces sp. DH37]
MNRRPHPPARPHGARTRLMLLVLAVLAGLVAMHGLGPAGPSDTARALPATGHAMPGPTAAPGVPGAFAGSGDGACAHSGHGTGGHLDHADTTCAAGGTSGAPPLPTLLPAATAPATAQAALRRAPADPPGSRSPPSLSELQLLLI